MAMARAVVVGPRLLLFVWLVLVLCGDLCTAASPASEAAGAAIPSWHPRRAQRSRAGGGGEPTAGREGGGKAEEDAAFGEDENDATPKPEAESEATWRACAKCELGRAEWPWGGLSMGHGTIGRVCYNPDANTEPVEVDSVELKDKGRPQRVEAEKDLIGCDVTVSDACARTSGTPCVGSDAKISSLPQQVSLGLPGFEARTFNRPTGATGRRMYVVTDPDGTRSVVKLGLRLKTFANVYPFGLLTKFCGFEDIVAREWRAPLRGEMPKEDGVKFAEGGTIDATDALFARYADGAPISLVKNLAHFRSPSETRNDKVLQDAAKIYLGLNKTQVRMATLEEFLFSQGDRHPENIYVTKEGNLQFIDNVDAVFGYYNWAWADYGMGMNVNTPFIPTTTVFEIERRGFTFPAPDPRIRGKEIYNSLGALLDYRCHVPGGKIGFDFGDKAKECINEISRMTVEDVRTRFKFHELRQAALLRAKAALLATKGFEGALDAMRSASNNLYPLLEPRCGLFEPPPHVKEGARYRPVDLLPCGIHEQEGFAADALCIGHADSHVNVLSNLADRGLLDLAASGCVPPDYCGSRQ